MKRARFVESLTIAQLAELAVIGAAAVVHERASHYEDVPPFERAPNGEDWYFETMEQMELLARAYDGPLPDWHPRVNRRAS